MTCAFCGYRNMEGEHRCGRCGRRPDDTLRSAYPTDGALAAEPYRLERVLPQPGAAVAGPPRDMRRAVQRPLFPEKPSSNIIPFEAYAPAPAAKPAKAAPRTPTRRAARRPAVSDAQASLDFLPATSEQPRTLGTTVEAVIYCEAPVATPLHRAIAAALDWSMVLIGYGLFLLAFSWAGGTFVLNRENLLMFGAILPLLGFTYGLLWTIAGGETFGMRMARLRLTTFDGFPPEPHQRIVRFAGSCLSFCTLLGLLWCLADEESLTWQDHMSRTFPTPLASDSRVFHRN